MSASSEGRPTFSLSTARLTYIDLRSIEEQVMCNIILAFGCSQFATTRKLARPGSPARTRGSTREGSNPIRVKALARLMAGVLSRLLTSWLIGKKRMPVDEENKLFRRLVIPVLRSI